MRYLKTIRKGPYILFLSCLFVISCEQAVSHIESPKEIIKPLTDSIVIVQDTVVEEKPVVKETSRPSEFKDLSEVDQSILIDIRYATEDNFTKQKLYECGKCLVLAKVATQLSKVNNDLKSYGYKLKMLDCYRPQSVQKKLWAINPDPQFVMSPSKGSGHGRGTAVDVTLVDMDGKELDMGSEYDEFSHRSIYMGKEIPQSCMRLRWILKKTMKAHGFNPIRTEWWHFQYGLRRNYPVQDFMWSCN